MAGGQGQYLDWGTGSSTSASVGLVVGGDAPGAPDSPINHREGIYAQDVMAGGMLEYNRSFDFLPRGTNDATLIGYALRSSFTAPTLTDLCFEGGHASEHGWKHTGCKIDEIELTQAVGDALQCSLTYQGTGGTRQDSPSPQSAETGKTYEWFKSDVAIDAGNYDVQEITVTVANNLEVYSDLDSKSENSERKPTGIKVGSEVVTCSLVMLTPANHSTLFDLDADDIDTDIDVVWTASNGTRDLTITLSNLACSANPQPFQAPDGLVVWNVELEAERNTSGVISIVDSAA
jgi:hypothetical protein